jgi:hypothetical protein
MPAKFDRSGIRFIYPENWTLQEEYGAGNFHDVSVESPEGGFWSVSVFDVDQTLNNMLDSIANTLREQYQDFERAGFEGEFGGYHCIGFDADFYCLDFLVTARARAFECQGRKIAVYCQAESRQFDKQQAVFDAMTVSLLRSSFPLED